MIQAKIIVFDDETGKVYKRNKIISPVTETYLVEDGSNIYGFEFKVRIVKDKVKEVIDYVD